MPSINCNEIDLSNVESVRRSEVFPKKCLKIINSKGDVELQENNGDDETDGADEQKSKKIFAAAALLPFNLLAGEYVDYTSKLCYSNEDAIYCTNYRLIVVYDKRTGFYNIPVRSIDCVDLKEMTNLHVFSKDGKFLRLCFENNAICLAWYRLLTSFIPGPQKLDSLFAFTFNAWSNDDENISSATLNDNLGLKSLDFYATNCGSKKNAKNHFRSTTKFSDKKVSRSLVAKLEFDSLRTCRMEFERLAFDNSKWKIVDLNKEYKFCSTYPRYFILPASVSDAHIEKVATFRSMRRVPAAVWRHKTNGAVLLRSSQPETGLLGWRNEADESVLYEVSKAAFNFSMMNRENSSCDESNVKNDVNAKTMLILDARSYGAAWANRAKGGGYENIVYYPNCDIEFLGMSNIHAVRYSFQQLRSLCWESCTTANGAGGGQNSESSSSAWLQALDSTQWIAYLHILLASALKVVETLHYQAKCVLVHCSDGWDRTTQIVSLAKLMLDPYYRTMTGFKELIEREWIAFGHKFGERTGLLAGDTSQRAPIFLQWLDCVRHVHKANPCSFEFNEIYLIKLAQHVYSGLFGNFLCNSAYEHATNNVSSRTFSIWSFLHPMNDQFKNVLYVDSTKDTDFKTRNVLTTPYKVRDLTDLWQFLYCPQSTDPAVKRQTNSMTLSTTSLESSATLSDDSDRTIMALSTASLLNNNNNNINFSTSSILNEEDDNNFSISYKELTGDSSGDLNGVESSSFCRFSRRDDGGTNGEGCSVVNDMISRLIVDVSTKIAVEDASRENGDVDGEIYSAGGAPRSRIGDDLAFFCPSAMSLVQTEDEVDDGYDSKAPTITPPESLPATCAVLKNDACTSTSDLPENFSKSCNETNNLSNNDDKNLRRAASFSGCSASCDEVGASCSQNDQLAASQITLKREKSQNKRSRKLNLRKLIDVDGLTKISVIHQEKMSKIINDYEQQLDRMNAELDKMRRLFYNQFSARSRNQSFTKNNERLISESSSDALELPVPLEKSMAILSDASWEAVNEAGGGSGSFAFNFNENNNAAAVVCCSGDSIENLDDLMENLDESDDFSCLMSTKTTKSSRRQRTSSCNGDFPQRPVSRCSACGMEFCPPKINNCRHCGALSCDSCSKIGQNGTNNCRECNWQVGGSKKYEAAKLCA